MEGFVISAVVGIICIILGIQNMRGNISSLHSYHRSRVKDEDVLPFGRIVGLGTVVVGGSIVLFSILGAIALLAKHDIFTLIGTAVMVVGIIAGLIISFYGMKKYNGGIF